jgi:hypothetical protein
MTDPTMANTMENIPDDLGTGNVGSVAATATAFHAETEGAANRHGVV